MGIYATNSRYDAVLLHRQKQAAAAELREARSEARRQAAEVTVSKSDSLRNTMGNVVAQANVNQSQLMAQMIRSRMLDQATAKAEPAKWYR